MGEPQPLEMRVAAVMMDKDEVHLCLAETTGAHEGVVPIPRDIYDATPLKKGDVVHAYLTENGEIKVPGTYFLKKEVSK